MNPKEQSKRAAEKQEETRKGTVPDVEPVENLAKASSALSDVLAQAERAYAAYTNAQKEVARAYKDNEQQVEAAYKETEKKAFQPRLPGFT